MNPELVDRLRRDLGADAVLTDPDVVTAYARDQAALAPAGRPAVVVLPRSTPEVQAVVRAAADASVPVVPRGAGSGLSGGANAVDSCIVLSLQHMDEILAIDAADLVAVVEPGVLNADLTTAAREQGLHYPPDPASATFSTIGGNLATNAGGLCCVKYGVTRDFVLGLEVVLADGSVARVGRRTVKGVTGYDLAGLFVGSEGTLGVITQAVLRLTPLPGPPTTLVAFFAALDDAGAAVAAATAAGVVPSLLELMDRTTIAAVDDWQRMGLDRDAAALLVAQSDAPGAQAEAETALLEECCTKAGATFVARATDELESEQLLAARRFAYPALERLGAALLDDVAVPRSRIPELLRAIEAVAARHGVLIGTFGHVGDGNMHPTVVYDPADDRSVTAARAAFGDILRAALTLGGTLTGEHGIGVLKRSYFAEEADPATQRLHAAVKAALDPQGILNPGKAF